MTEKINSTFLKIAFILFLVILSQSAIDIYLPSLPQITKSFASNIQTIQFTVPFFLICCGISQMFYGPYSDSAGRRPALLVGMTVFILGSLICAISLFSSMLLVGRAVQGIGIGAASVLSRAISRDLFEGAKLRKLASYIAIAWAMVPMIAPIFGGYLASYFGWRMNFCFLIFFSSILLFLLVFVLPETSNSSHRTVFNVGNVIENYISLLNNQLFIGYSLCATLLFGIFITFNIVFPFLFQNKLGVSPVKYAWLNLFIALGYLVGSYLNSKLVKHFSATKIIFCGFFLLFLICVFFIVFTYFEQQNIVQFIMVMFFVMFSIGLIYANCIAGSLSPFPKMAGSASALYGCFVLTGSCISGIIVSYLPITPIVLSIILFVQAMLALSVFLITQFESRKKNQYQ